MYLKLNINVYIPQLQEHQKLYLLYYNMGNLCCPPFMKSEQYASLLEESNYIEMSSSNILDNNIRELNNLFHPPFII